jgi:hypothetical protein
MLGLSAASPIYAVLAALQIFSLVLAFAGMRTRVPLLHRIAAPASALLLLNAAAVVGLYKFLTTRGPLWKLWNSTEPLATGATRETHGVASTEPVAASESIDIAKGI